jgi:predicted MFS family arabinose efflux permease
MITTTTNATKRLPIRPRQQSSDVGSGVAQTTIAPQYLPRRRLVWLALGTFALGTESLVIGGVLPSIAEDLNSDVATAGLLVSVFALTYAISAPVMGMLLSRFAPKRVLSAAMVAFVVANLFAAFAPSMGWLMVARVATGIAASMYTPNASAMAGALSRPEERGRSLALVYMGLSLATVFGVPLGTIVAGFGSWRTTFLFVAGIGAIATLGVMKFLPEAPKRPRTTKAQWVAVLSNRQVIRALTITAVFFTAQFAAFTYIAKLITQVAGHPKVSVPIALFTFGIAGFVGNTTAGRLADTWGPSKTSRLAATLMAIGLAALTPLITLGTGVVAIIFGSVALIVWGVGGWALLPAQQVRLLQLAPDAAPTVLAANSSALYLGTATGGLVGSTIVGTIGLNWIGLIGAAIALSTLTINRKAQS